MEKLYAVFMLVSISIVTVCDWRLGWLFANPGNILIPQDSLPATVFGWVIAAAISWLIPISTIAWAFVLVISIAIWGWAVWDVMTMTLKPVNYHASIYEAWYAHSSECSHTIGYFYSKKDAEAAVTHHCEEYEMVGMATGVSEIAVFQSLEDWKNLTL